MMEAIYFRDGVCVVDSLDLRIFREVARCRSISKAADVLGYVQSNITAHIRSLEEETGTVLFTRHSRGVTLTRDGEELLAYANRIVQLLDEAGAHFRAERVVLRVGATQTIAAHRLPVWISAFRKENTSAQLTVTTGIQAELIRSVVEGNLDCAFVNTAFSDPRLTSVLSFRDELALIAPAGLHVDDLARQAIVVTNISGCPYRNLLERWMRQNWSSIPTVVEFDTLEGILKAVLLGVGISLLPVNVLPDSPGIQIIHTDGIGEVHNQLVMKDEAPGELLRSFIRIVEADIRENALNQA